MILDFFQRNYEPKEPRATVTRPGIELLAMRLHWVYWKSEGWRPAKNVTMAYAWKARDERVKSVWRAVAEEALLSEEML